MAKKDEMGTTPEDTSVDLSATPGEDTIPEEAPPEELMAKDTGMGNAGKPGAVMTHTIDELPGLINFAEGDDVTFKVAKVSDDGKSYDLEFVETPSGTEAMKETMMV